MIDREQLKKLYPFKSNKELSKYFGISEQMVQRKAYQMWLKKNPKYLSDVNRRNGISTQYG